MYYVAEDYIGEGADLSLTACRAAFDDPTSGACYVNDSTFHNPFVAKKGATLHMGSGSGGSVVEVNRCLVINATCGVYIEDEPQGEGGAFSVGGGTTLIMQDTIVRNSTTGKKVCGLYHIYICTTEYIPSMYCVCTILLSCTKVKCV